MVVRTRLRSIVLPIVFYLALGMASFYLVWGASNGEHGLNAKAKFDQETEALKAELGALKDEHGTRRNMAPFIEVECVWGVITGFSISGVILTVGSV